MLFKKEIGNKKLLRSTESLIITHTSLWVFSFEIVCDMYITHGIRPSVH